MALALTETPDAAPTFETRRRSVRLGPIVMDCLPDPDTTWDTWEPIGVRAACELFIDIGTEDKPWVIIQRIESPGCWGIETPDAQRDPYCLEVFNEEVQTLLAMLRELGCAALEYQTRPEEGIAS
jgi:hypothetical protein